MLFRHWGLDHTKCPPDGWKNWHKTCTRFSISSWFDIIKIQEACVLHNPSVHSWGTISNNHRVLFSFEFSNNHLSLNRISVLVVTGAQCSRKKEKTKMLLSNPSHVFISPLSHAVASSSRDKLVDSWFEEGKKTWLSLLSSVITHCLLLYHCSNLTCCCYYL